MRPPGPAAHQQQPFACPHRTDDGRVFARVTPGRVPPDDDGFYGWLRWHLPDGHMELLEPDEGGEDAGLDLLDVHH
ncbi:hypothetical protein [Streptomonospora alba]|uniref:hypothetical protein n=1 Tax=Streptomonospora alba TaxID=183763 RepID=UPI0012EE9DDB|nr:hypothetical protein [Streptomonospora alba]